MSGSTEQLDDVQALEARPETAHALPKGWYKMEYSAFLEARRRAMAGVVREAFEQLSRQGRKAPSIRKETPIHA